MKYNSKGNNTNGNNQTKKTSKRKKVMTVVQLRLAAIKKRIRRIEAAQRLLKRTPIPFHDKQT
jgi:hypothetical protein